ncbi:MAG: ankyrin repeat domain-containing protein [Treponema sp.]|jgi:hypothetical protein|nr:ankyrin repeat domain-containing protein [Treponema sp.]
MKSIKTIDKILFFAFFLGLGAVLSQSVSADDYRWNLINALSKSNYQEVEAIIRANINSMSASEKRITMSFVLTYSRGDTALQSINLLSDYGVIPNSYDLYTALNMNQSDDVIRLILNHGAAVNGEILLNAMARQRFNFARQFIEMGADVNYSYPLARRYADGMTPLLYASKWNNLELVRLLLEKGANINARSREGDTALSLAHANGNTQISNLLMERGALPGLNSVPQSQAQSAAGISSLLSNQVELQRGTYRLSGGDINIRFAGSPSAGNINYTINGRSSNGTYRIAGNNLTVTMEGQTFLYKIDSNTTFSGNGETWIRTGN